MSASLPIQEPEPEEADALVSPYQPFDSAPSKGVPHPIALVMAAFHAHLNHRVGCNEQECRLFACDGWDEKAGRYVCPCGRRSRTARLWRRHLRDVHGAERNRRGRWWLRTQRQGELKARADRHRSRR